MKIGELAAHSGVTPKTLRFWEEQGLLPPPARTPAGYRAYAGDAVERIGFIRNAQAAGLMLDQIRQILAIGDSGRPPCEHVGELIAERLAAVEARITELGAARDHLRALARRAAAQNPADCRGYCVIIQPARAEATGARSQPDKRPPTPLGGSPRTEGR